MDEAQSLTEVLKLSKQDAQESVPSVSKATAEEEDIIIDDDDDDDASETASLKSVSSTASSLKTLAAKKRVTQEKYPNFCSLKEVQLYYPTDSNFMHTTGVNPSFISAHQKMGE